MHPLSEYTKQDCFYSGERQAWYVLLTRNRDSDCLSQSNWDTALKRLGGESDTVAIERMGHWLCGWIEYLLICPNDIDTANEIEQKLEDYPVLDEEDFSNQESEEANRVWKDCYNVKERIAYIRAKPHEFNFHNFRDLLAQCRGKYFSGYASELIY